MSARITDAERLEAIALVAKLAPLGGCECLHCVTEDLNLEDAFVTSGLEEARRLGHADCERLAVLLLKMKTTQRGKVSRQGNNLWRASR